MAEATNTRIFSIGDEVVFRDNTASENLNDSMRIIDSTWVDSMFMVRNTKLDEFDQRNRYWSNANLKFTDTRMGGSLGINARPQFTRYADVKIPGRIRGRNNVSVNERNGDLGLGRYYSEAIDDNTQILYMEFGVAEFNSLFSYFTRAIDFQTMQMARTGSTSTAYSAGKITGNVAVLLAFPVVSLAIWGIKAIKDVLIGSGSFDYYYLKPTMHVYWSTVNSIVTTMATELGITIPEFMPDKQKAQTLGIPLRIDTKDMEDLHRVLPDIFTENNYIDVFAIANKAQVLANRQMRIEHKKFIEGKEDDDDFVGFLKTDDTLVEGKPWGSGFSAMLNDVLSLSGLYENKPEDTPSETSDPTPLGEVKEEAESQYDSDGNVKKNETDEDPSYLESAAKYFDAAARGGSAHAVFKVDYVGSVSESFSNSVTEIPASGMIKSISQQGRHAQFNFAGGNIAGGVIDDALSGLRNFVKGTLDSVTFGLSAITPSLFGGAYMDVPKMWDDSQVSLPTLTFKTSLVSPYGNTISQLQNIYIPLAMLMAGAMPLGTGKASYTSPFLCNMFLKGVQHIKLGMITNLTITRGTTNLAFNKQKKALGIDVTFTVTDFSSMMSAPVNSGLGGAFTAAMDDSSVFSKYIATLASRDLRTTMYAMPKAKLRLARLSLGVSAITSPAYAGMRTGSIFNNIAGGLLADQALTMQETNPG